MALVLSEESTLRAKPFVVVHTDDFNRSLMKQTNVLLLFLFVFFGYLALLFFVSRVGIACFSVLSPDFCLRRLLTRTVLFTLGGPVNF